MPGRILTLQRQARELGRLRTGLTETKNGKTFPTRSTTWILTSHQRDYLDAAAEEWGGQVEEWQPQGNGAKAWRVITDAVSVDAILPPGDPLSQAYEMWSRGGCQRRCDGETESLSSKPCLCRAAFGDDFHLQEPDKACRPHTRLNVILPGLPDLGVWRMESKGFYAANEIAAAVDMIRHATGGAVRVPVRLRIEPRQRVAQGKTKKYPVIVVEIRGATAGQILAGQPATVELEGAPQRQALEAGPSDPHAQPTTTAPALDADTALRAIAAARSQKQLDMVKADCQAAGVRDQQVLDAWMARSQELAAAPQQPPAEVEPDGEVMEGEPEPDADTVWAQINGHVGKNQKWSAEELEKRVISLLGKDSAEANGWELQHFLIALRNGEVA